MLLLLNYFIARLDVIVSFAELSTVVSQSHPYVRPIFSANNTSSLRIIDGRHPCVERYLDLSSPFIPNSLLLDRATDSDNRFQIITGPNMGGKSTFIKQVCRLHMTQ